jgi:16S rRNA processing protein RimM
VSELVPVGRVGRPHGLDGSFFVEGPSDEAARFAKGAELRVDGEPAAVVASKRAGGRPVIRLDRPAPRGAVLSVPREALPAPEGAATWYAFELVGLEVVEEDGRALGRVTRVEPGVANDVLEVDAGRLLLPFVDACVRDVDVAAGRIVVAPGFADPLDA